MTSLAPGHPRPSSPAAAWDWTDLAAGLAPSLAQAAGDGAFPVSISLDLADAGEVAAAEPRFEARLERATRTLAFVTGEARTPDGRLLAAATAVFRRR